MNEAKQFLTARQAFDEAYKNCLCDCYGVLAGNLIYQPEQLAEAEFRKCCARCQRAKLLADIITEEPCQPPST